MKIGIICPSEIALRRFMPALIQSEDFEFVGIGVCNKEERFGDTSVDDSIVEDVLCEERAKAEVFIEQYGGKIYDSYEAIVSTDEIDAIYIPLPPGLHYKWAIKALNAGKHVLVEKPSTLSAKDSMELVEAAKRNNVALHENYMFAFHEQLDAVNKYIEEGNIGDVRLIRISFGFPKRAQNDFRYNKALGGGALIDAGGYTLKYASILLGDTANIKTARMNYTEEHDVDMYGSATMENEDGLVAQIAFGMDNNYKCDLEVWGSKAHLFSGRILTAPAGFTPNMVIRRNNEEEVVELPADDTFLKSLNYFAECIGNKETREHSYEAIVRQAKYVDGFREAAKRG